MYRFFCEHLKYWKNKINRKPLIISGARQTGKTYIVRQFANKNFDNLLEINFERNLEICQLFELGDTQAILNNLEIFFDTKITPGKTLIFFDELQTCPKAIEKLRYFYEDHPDLHLIAAGSLLNLTLNEFKYSMPVGRVEFAYLYPMNFFEFLMAIEQHSIYQYLQNFSLKTQIPEPIHSKILNLLSLYYLIGGMPEAVKVYVQTNSLKEVENVHESILTSLQFDFAKYGTRKQQQILIKLLRYLPKALGRKFKYVAVDKNLRSDEIRRSLELLEHARILHRLYHTSASTPPLEYAINPKIFKPVFLDIGLANHLLHLRLTTPEILLENRGALAEQFIAQQLLTLPPFYLERKLFYWQREKKNAEAELDLITEHNSKVLPIEIKSGKEGRLKSLQVYMYEKKLKLAIRFYAGLPKLQNVSANIRLKNGTKHVRFQLLSLPLYLALRTFDLLDQYESKK